MLTLKHWRLELMQHLGDFAAVVQLLECFSRRQLPEKAMPHHPDTGCAVASCERQRYGTPVLVRHACTLGLAGLARRINMAIIAWLRTSDVTPTRAFLSDPSGIENLR